MVKTSGGDWQDILQGSVSTLIWDPINGKTLLIAMEDGTLYSATFPDFTPQSMATWRLDRPGLLRLRRSPIRPAQR